MRHPTLPLAATTVGLAIMATCLLTPSPAAAATPSSPLTSTAQQAHAPAPDQELAYYLVKVAKLPSSQQVYGKLAAINPQVVGVLQAFDQVRVNGQPLHAYLAKINPHSPEDPQLRALLAKPDYKALLTKFRSLAKYADMLKVLKASTH